MYLKGDIKKYYKLLLNINGLIYYFDGILK